MPGINYTAFKLPGVNTKEPLGIVFSEGMDYVSILTGVKIFTVADSLPVNGKIMYTQNDNTWNFVPEQKWKGEAYQIRFDKVVADFASNHLHRLFEITDINKLNEETMPRKWNFTPKLN